jgi:hypothetical protein
MLYNFLVTFGLMYRIITEWTIEVNGKLRILMQEIFLININKMKEYNVYRAVVGSLFVIVATGVANEK